MKTNARRRRDGYFLTARQVARRNAEFDEMTKAEKRVAIAKDVLTRDMLSRVEIAPRHSVGIYETRRLAN